MSLHETVYFPDGDVILRATDGTESRDFRVHKWLLSYSSPVFKGMFEIPQPPPATPKDVDIIPTSDPPRALDVILRLIYPSPSSPVVEDFAVLSEALIVADKYGIGVARTRLRPSFVEFAKTEPLRAYAIAYRCGFTDEMKIASWHTTSIHLPGLPELPSEFKDVPATEYHRLIVLHSKYRNAVQLIATRTSPPSTLGDFYPRPQNMEEVRMVVKRDGAAMVREAVKELFEESIGEGIPLNHESLVYAMRKSSVAVVLPNNTIQLHASSILSQARELNLTV